MAFFSANFMLQTPQEDTHQPFHSLSPILTSCTPQEFHGFSSCAGKRSMPYSGVDKWEETHGEDEALSDDGMQLGEKKRRLSIGQVKALEKSFELGNKLEPDRKMQLAMALGLQPRQVAIWFQNRRARWKTKQLEKDYDLLKRQYVSIKADNEAIQAQNQRLQAEIMALKNIEPAELINLNKGTDQGASSNRSENSTDIINLDISRTPPAIDSPSLTHHPNSMSLFPTYIRSNGVAQLFPTSPRPDLQCPKADQIVKEESFTNMLYGIGDQSGYWPWLEPLHYS